MHPHNKGSEACPTTLLDTEEKARVAVYPWLLADALRWYLRGDTEDGLYSVVISHSPNSIVWFRVRLHPGCRELYPAVD